MEEELFNCSWCYTVGAEFEEVDRGGFVTRETWECQECAGRCARCLYCVEGMARSFPDGHDKFCYACWGRSWEQGPPPFEKAWCSWCFKQTGHLLYRRNLTQRNDYICTNPMCGQATIQCRKMCGAMARRHPTWADELCGLCDGTIKSWDNVPEDLLTRSAWCSWCCSLEKHKLIQSRVGMRGVFRCGACGMSGCPCVSCDDGMSCASLFWNDRFCVSCSGKYPWEDIKERREALFQQSSNPDRVDAELARSSKSRDEAIAAGLERPFLLLVSMPGFSRSQVASYLGFSLLTTDCFGDVHQESWLILSRNVYGFQARCNGVLERLNFFGRNCNWWEMLTRVLQTLNANAVPTTDDSSLENQDIDSVRDVEERVILCLMKMSKQHQRMVQKQSKLFGFSVEDINNNINNNKQAHESSSEDSEAMSSDVDLADAVIHDRLRNAAGFTRNEVIQWGVDVTKAASRAPGPVALGLIAANWMTTVGGLHTLAPLVASVSAGAALVATPLFFLGVASLSWTAMKIAFGGTEGRLVEPMLMLITQRILLASSSGKKKSVAKEQTRKKQQQDD